MRKGGGTKFVFVHARRYDQLESRERSPHRICGGGPLVFKYNLVALRRCRSVSYLNIHPVYLPVSCHVMSCQALAASVAVGLSSTFAATIGGVLFSIEITTLYYDLGNYFKAFVAAISGTVAVSLLRTLVEGSPVSERSQPRSIPQKLERRRTRRPLVQRTRRKIVGGGWLVLRAFYLRSSCIG